MRHLIITLLATFLLAGSARASGLLAPTDQTLPPLRVTDHLVNVTIEDGIAITTVTQTFHNDTGQRLEATYIFPLPEEGDLTDFQMTFNGKMVQGKVLPADQAVQIYESIVRQMKDPGLIEFIGRRLLQMRVFPIEPESDTTIQVKYQQICRPISGMTGFHYPLRTRKTAGQAYGTVRFNVELDSAAPLKNIWSPTHAVEIVRNGENEARIAYEASGGSLEEDFMLLYDTDSSDLGLNVVAYKPDEGQPGHFVLMLTPKQLWPQQDYQPQDVIFVLDTSGSMAGEKIEQAKRSLNFCIDKLDERDRFSVVRFSTGFDLLFEELAAATKENRAKAQNFVDKFSAAGGTNITDTLTQVLAMQPESERPFVVVFLTDGQGNRTPDEIMAALEKKAGEHASMRVFPFGVGHDVNTVLLDRLSESFTGRTTYVQPGENLELVLGDFFSVISQPVLTDLRLVLPEIGATERFPATLGDLYHGQQIIVAGRYDTATSGPIKLTARRGEGRVEYAWPNVDFTGAESAEYVPAVWAGRKIAYLIDQIRRHVENDEMIAEVIALSQEFGIQTPYTSWLVNPEQEERLVRLRGMAPGARPTVIPGGAEVRGGGTGGGGAIGRAGPPTARREQLRALQSAGVDASTDLSIVTGRTATFGDEFGSIDLYFAAEALGEEAGEAANLIARKNAELRDARSVDGTRIDADLMLTRKINGLWYNRLGQFLVDERIGEGAEFLVIRFGSKAYFELVKARPDLRKILAAQPQVVVMAGEKRAVVISDRAGVEELTDENREQIGRGAGSDDA